MLDFLSLIKYYTFRDSESEVIKKMSPRTGRPKADKPKRNEVMVRFDDDTFEQLNKYCKDHNVARTVAIRKGVSLLLESEQKKK